MAACRLLNAGLGAAAGALTASAALPLGLLFGYVLTLTVVSRFEVMTAPVALVRGAAGAFTALLLVSAGLLVTRGGGGGVTGVVFLAALAFWLGRPLRAALADPAPRRIIGVIKAAVLGIILLDAAFVAAAGGAGTGARPFAADEPLTRALGAILETFGVDGAAAYLREPEQSRLRLAGVRSRAAIGGPPLPQEYAWGKDLVGGAAERAEPLTAPEPNPYALAAPMLLGEEAAGVDAIVAGGRQPTPRGGAPRIAQLRRAARTL